MKNYLDRTLSILLTGATLISATVLVRREFSQPPSAPGRGGPPRYVESWRKTMGYGIRFGPAAAPLQIVEFTDFECPFCRRFHEAVLPRVFEAFPDSVGLVLLHFPLPMHRFAGAAARAVECASLKDPAPRHLVDLLYAKQDSFGLKQWASFGAEGGVTDTLSFARCILSGGKFARIDAGTRFATEFGVRGTPGIMLNGWLFNAPPSDSSLIHAGRLLLAGGNQLPQIVAPRQH